LEKGVLVPSRAVQLRGSQYWTYVQLEPGVFEGRKISVGYEGLDKVLVTNGLKGGDLVVSENGLLLARELRNAQASANPNPIAAAPK
jgi:hypothetical protein